MINIFNISNSLSIALVIHILGFMVLLIFLTIDRSISNSRNYSPDFTVSTSKILLYVYILLGTYLSYEIGYDFAYEEFLTSAIICMLMMIFDKDKNMENSVCLHIICSMFNLMNKS